jgi:hypothetical protein
MNTVPGYAHLLGLAQPPAKKRVAPPAPTEKRRAAAQSQGVPAKRAANQFQHLVGLEPAIPIDNSASIQEGWARAFDLAADRHDQSVAASWTAAFKKARP